MLKPLKEHIVIEIELRHPEKVTESGIFVNEEKLQGIPYHGVVVAIGESVTDDPIYKDLAVGKRVVYNEQKPHGFKFEGLKLLRLHKQQIIGIYD